MEVKWKGVYPAVTTAFTAAGDLDIPTFLANIEAQVAAGVDGIVVAGSLGESSTLNPSERLELLSAARERVGHRVPVLLNVAEGSLRRAIDLVQRAAVAGADGFMLLPPMMYRATDAEVVAYFQAIAYETDLPIMLYNNPVDYKIEVTLDMLDTLQALPQVQAIKESTRDISNVTRLRNRFGERYRILCGVDTLAMEALLMGADGWVAGLVDAFPAETVAIYRLIQAGRTAEARAIYRWFMPLLELDIDPQLVQNIKLAEAMTGLGTEHVRLPRLPLSGAARERVERIVQAGLDDRPILPDYLSITDYE